VYDPSADMLSYPFDLICRRSVHEKVGYDIFFLYSNSAKILAKSGQ